MEEEELMTADASTARGRDRDLPAGGGRRRSSSVPLASTRLVVAPKELQTAPVPPSARRPNVRAPYLQSPLILSGTKHCFRRVLNAKSAIFRPQSIE